MENKNNCKLCNKECVDVSEKIYCEGPCGKTFHSKCIGFTPVSLKFYRTTDNLIFECSDCRDNPYRTLNVTLNKMLSFMCIFEERLKRQEANCESMNEQFETINCNIQKCENEMRAEMNKATIAVLEAAKKSSSNADIDKTTVPDPIVLVQPKIKQKCSATRAMLDEKNIPKQIEILSVNNMPNGGVKIHCKSGKELSKLHEDTVKELSEDYTIIIPTMRNPKIRVVNMCEKRSEMNIIDCIRKQNELIKDADMKVLHVFNVKSNETYGAIIEVDAPSFDVLMKEKKVFIGTDVCNITESLSVLRCFKCCGYNHKSYECRNNKACLRCGGEHIMKECKAKQNVCINCKITAEKRNVNIDWNHPAWSKQCTVLRKYLDREKLRTVYA